MRPGLLLRTAFLFGALSSLLLAGAQAAGETHLVFGADTSPAQRQELGSFFGAGEAGQAATVTTPEMISALNGTGLPVAQDDRSISSAAVTCLNKGDGLDVRTQNITRLTPPVYANALMTAGASDARVVIAAPGDEPVTGETALVGVLKVLPQCLGGKPLDPARVDLAYKQIAWTATLAGDGGDLNKASETLMRAQQPVVSGSAANDDAISAAIDSASSTTGVAIDSSLRPPLITFLSAFRGLDLGAFSAGYAVQFPTPNEVQFAPANNAAAASPRSSAATSSQSGAQRGDLLAVALPIAILLGIAAVIALRMATKRTASDFLLEPIQLNRGAHH